MVRVAEQDFDISSPRHVSSGKVVLRVKNEGPDSHELIVVRANGRLPLRPDGMTIDEEALSHRTVGALEPGAVGSVRYLRLHLKPGRYEFVCNMAGHYMAGMHTEVRVR